MDKLSTITTLTSGRPKWQYPPAPPTPRILHLPRRPRRKPLPKANATEPNSHQIHRKGKLEALFDQERGFARGDVPVVMVSGGGNNDQFEEKRRQRVEERENVVLVEEEKSRFQAETLRAECNLLRMEREIAVKKMERRRVEIERILRSAIQTLLSGRKRICDGKNVSLVLDEEIQELSQTLEKLQRKSGVRDLEVNFDKKASVLKRRLEKFGGESDELCDKEIQVMAEASLSINTTCKVDENFISTPSCNMEVLRQKMEGLSKGNLLERIKNEYGSMLSTANSSAASSSFTFNQTESPDMFFSSVMQHCMGPIPHEEKTGSGCCKAMVQRIVEQVRAETEQWSQMQEMLGQVRDEMEELQASRDFWENRALDSDYQIQSLHSAVQEWRKTALSSEAKTHELEAQVSVLHVGLEKLRKAKGTGTARSKNLPAHCLDAPNEMEKRVLVCRFKENCYTQNDGCKQEGFSDGRRKCYVGTRGPNASKHSPFREIGNSSPLLWQHGRDVFPPNLQENFRNNLDVWDDFSTLHGGPSLKFTTESMSI